MVDTDKPLDDIMEFEHVIEVLPDGSIIDRNDLYAPDLLNGELVDDTWSLMDGWSGQYMYSGPVMHDSEYIGKRMEAWIRETPGVYVLVAAYYDDEDAEDEDAELIVEGWGVAYRETPLCGITNCYEYRDREVHGKNVCATHAAELDAL